MRHLELSKITDLVRGCLPDDERERIVRHLSMCGKCQATADIFAKVVLAAADERLHTPPAADVHCAKALFSLQGLPSVESSSGVKARLIFDSFRQSELAGVRGSRRTSRQAVFATREVSVDLSQQLQENASRVRLTGQVLSKADGLPLIGIHISLIGDSEVVAERTTNRFGEFEMIYAPKRSLRLVIAEKSSEIASSN